MNGTRLLVLFGAAWLSLLTMLLCYIASTVASIQQIQQQQTLLLSQLKITESRTQASASKTTTTCPPCQCQCNKETGATGAATVGTLQCPSVTCPITTCPDASENKTPDSCPRPQLVRPVLHWMGVDIGRDLFHHLTTWSKDARNRHELVVEVGAGDGRQAAMAAKLGYRVISIDASKKNLELGENIYKEMMGNSNATGNLTRIWSAVANYTGEAKFWAMSGMGRLLDSHDKRSITHKDNPKWADKVETVPVNKLDDLVKEVPWLLKIDVEGHELGVLQGAARMLQQRPKVVIFEFNPVMMEWSAKSDAYEVLHMMHDLGYELYDGQISEPAKKGFVAKYGSMYRPTGFRELIQYFNKSREFDWWGSWTDILAIMPGN